MDGLAEVDAAAQQHDQHGRQTGDQTGRRGGAQNVHGGVVGHQRGAGGQSGSGDAAGDQADQILAGDIGLRADGQHDGEQREQGAEGVDAAEAHGPADRDADVDCNGLLAGAGSVAGKDLHQGAGDIDRRAGFHIHAAHQNGQHEDGKQAGDKAGGAAQEGAGDGVQQGDAVDQCDKQGTQRGHIHDRHALIRQHDQRSECHNDGQNADGG